MILDSSRYRPGDLGVWALREVDDLRRAGSARLAGLEARALASIRAFLAAGDRPAYVGTSWGKDSVTVAHLVRRVDASTELVYGAFAGDDSGGPQTSADGHSYMRRENPHCRDVRDAYLARWPMPYREVEWGYRADGRSLSVSLRRAYPHHRRLTGIRAQESGVRTLSAHVHGVSTAGVCRPILRWSLAAVFAYLARYDLPVHPSYAMSMEGALERDALRVDTIGGPEGVDRGRREWERAYYADAEG